MDAWITFARGPLFRIALAVCLLGLAYRIGVAIFAIVQAWRHAGDRRIPTSAVVRATATWILPTRLARSRPVYSVASILFHAGILLVPLFFLGHVALWQASLPIPWPTLQPLAADILSLAAAAALLGLLIARLWPTRGPALTMPQDIAILAVLFFLTLSGFLAAHPGLSPIGGRGMTLTHILLGDLALVLTPTTKIAHCILFPLTQLTGEVGWHFPEASGRHVAVALAKENEKV